MRAAQAAGLEVRETERSGSERESGSGRCSGSERCSVIVSGSVSDSEWCNELLVVVMMTLRTVDKAIYNVSAFV